MSRKMIAMAVAVFFTLAFALVCLCVGSSISRIWCTEAVIAHLTDQVRLLGKETVHKQKNLARWYNYCLSSKEPQEGFEAAYEGILNYGGMIGYLEVPDAEIRLPICHGVKQEDTRRSVGHLPGSAFPIGGSGNHTVMIGPVGFGKLEEGDLIYIHVLDETLVYEVRQVRNVSPGQTSGLQSVDGEDLCTLITSKTTGMETRKIMIHAVRTDAEREQEAIAMLAGKPGINIRLIAAAAAAAVAALFLPMVAWMVGSVARVIIRKEICRGSTKNVT